MKSFLSHLSEGPLSPIPKTAKPNLFHGNYGGKGNRGGKPVDKLDQAFQKHDTGYHHTPDPKKRLKHDKSLVKATSSIVKDKSQPIKTRVKAGMATALFKTKLALKEDGGAMVGGVPANNVGDGNIAGLGVGSQGEPGVNKKKKKMLGFLSYMKRPTSSGVK